MKNTASPAMDTTWEFDRDGHPVTRIEREALSLRRILVRVGLIVPTLALVMVTAFGGGMVMLGASPTEVFDFAATTPTTLTVIKTAPAPVAVKPATKRGELTSTTSKAHANKPATRH